MKTDIIREGFIAEGTTCTSCEKIIKKQALKVKGVESVEFSYETQTGYVIFDKTKTDLDTILSKIEEKNYSCYILDEDKPQKKSSVLGIVFGIIGIIIVGYFLLQFMEGINVPKISMGMSYGLLFIVGFLTGFHCIAMCGGFVISYTAKDAKEDRSSHMSHIKYGLGKTLSYTIIGAIFGLIGSIIAFTPAMRGVAGILAGLFLIIFGINMLNLIPALRKFRIRLPSSLSKFVSAKHKNQGPLIIGLLNGLMIACGPLQAIYIMAAGTGSMIEGAKLLFVFGLGTLPVMLGFGYFASFMSSKMTQKILKASGIIVIILGLVMLNRGLALTGSGMDIGSLTASATLNNDNGIVMEDGYQVINMDVVASGYSPNKFVLKKDVPVKWKINGKQLTGCNNAIQVPKLGLEFDLKEGDQTIEFTPTEEGVISWSCWMGMIPGSFIVKEDVSDTEEIQKEIAQPIPSGSTCGAVTGGGCGCGA